MSIQSEINRINQAKNDILAALTEKGVDTTGAGLADIAALVAGIQAGGGGGSDLLTVLATGTITPSSDISFKRGNVSTNTPLEIVHNSGKIPKAVYLTHPLGTPSLNYLDAYVEIYLKDIDTNDDTSYCVLTRRASSNYYATKGKSGWLNNWNWTENAIYLGTATVTAQLKSGVTYEWTIFA